MNTAKSMVKKTDRKNNKKQNEEEPYTDGECKSSQIYRKLITATLQTKDNRHSVITVLGISNNLCLKRSTFARAHRITIILLKKNNKKDKNHQQWNHHL